MGEEWLNHMVGIYLIFLKTVKLLSKVDGLCVHGRHLLTFATSLHQPHDLSESCLMTTLMSVSTDVKSECL